MRPLVSVCIRVLVPLALACRQPAAGVSSADAEAGGVYLTAASSSADPSLSSPPPPPNDPDEARAYRAQLVRSLAHEVMDPRVLDAMGRVPRHLFAPRLTLWRAYADSPQPIGYGQTISQPAVVAIMTEALELRGRERVLEIGTGSGYQAAILSLLASEVFTIEIVKELADESRDRLRALGYANVHVRAGDGYKGWPAHAPFDRILVTAAPDAVPAALFEQLKDGGILVAPVGPQETNQRLLRYRKTHGRISREDLGPVRFVPMVRGD